MIPPDLKETPMHDELYTFGSNGDFVRALVDHQVDFMVVGGLAMVFHGCRDAMNVDDLDLMLNPIEDNAERLIRSLSELGFPVRWSATDLSKPNIQLPIKQNFYLDILTPPDGVDYDAMKQRSLPARLDNIPVHVVSREDLIALKRIAVARQENEIAKHKKDLQCLTNA
jgi:predicted nucleotidyltransferase